jgi:hypothetical protein
VSQLLLRVRLHIALFPTTLLAGSELRGGVRILRTFGCDRNRKRRHGDASQRARWTMLELSLFQASGCFMSPASWCLRCHSLRHHANDCLRPRRPPPRSSLPRSDIRVTPRDHPLASDSQLLSTTVAAGSDLGLTLSASDDLAMIALAAAKAAIMVALRLEDDDFTSPLILSSPSCSWPPYRPRSFRSGF